MLKLIAGIFIGFIIVVAGGFYLLKSMVKINTDEAGSSVEIGSFLKVDGKNDSVSLFNGKIQVDGKSETVKVGDSIYVDGKTEEVNIQNGNLLVDGKTQTTTVIKEWVLSIDEENKVVYLRPEIVKDILTDAIPLQFLSKHMTVTKDEFKVKGSVVETTDTHIVIKHKEKIKVKVDLELETK